MLLGFDFHEELRTALFEEHDLQVFEYQVQVLNMSKVCTTSSIRILVRLRTPRTAIY